MTRNRLANRFLPTTIPDLIGIDPNTMKLITLAGTLLHRYFLPMERIEKIVLSYEGYYSKNNVEFAAGLSTSPSVNNAPSPADLAKALDRILTVVDQHILIPDIEPSSPAELCNLLGKFRNGERSSGEAFETLLRASQLVNPPPPKESAVPEFRNLRQIIVLTGQMLFTLEKMQSCNQVTR